MDNDLFVKKLIAGTKSSQLDWLPTTSKQLSTEYPSYYIEKSDKKLVLEKYKTTQYDGFGDEIQSINCQISIYDDQGNELSDIYEDDLKKSGDLWRLYRIVERKANKVDDIMQSFVDDIDD